MLYPRLFIRGFSDFQRSVRPYLHPRLTLGTIIASNSGQTIFAVFSTRVSIIGFHPQLLVVEPTKLLLLDSLGLAAD
nr:MAG TPA: hypothetical protein [Caudoviricetes sp.]